MIYEVSDEAMMNSSHFHDDIRTVGILLFRLHMLSHI